MKKDALISECGKYRYSLSRVWDDSKPSVLFIMLNPSTADAYDDDPTIRRCNGFAKSWGYGGLIVCNLFAYRSKDPRELLKVKNPQGNENITYLEYYANFSEKIICAWGNESILKRIPNQRHIVEFIYQQKSKVHYLELSKNGTPKHPLYLKKDLIPIKL
ncbi:DUF1643 domain-containing protein [Epilithonimonas sp.]|uniref:DUF1643 domain-containing protein n=1 Tax=Epilithonimonas sp. TaxID=2894511 RepID=UPI0035B19911